jgi:hypothetical protein
LAFYLGVSQAGVSPLPICVIENRIGSHFRATLRASPILRGVHELPPNTRSPALRYDKPAFEKPNRACFTSISIFSEARLDETLDRGRLRLRYENGKARWPSGDARAPTIVVLVGKTRPQGDTHSFPCRDVSSFEAPDNHAPCCSTAVETTWRIACSNLGE